MFLQQEKLPRDRERFGTLFSVGTRAHTRRSGVCHAFPCSAKPEFFYDVPMRPIIAMIRAAEGDMMGWELARLCVGVIAGAALASPALADFNVCNRSSERVSVSVGYEHDDYGWTSEGWWTIPTDECATLLHGPLKGRYYYIYAHGKRTTWGGSKSQEGGAFCTRSEKYTLHNPDYASGNELRCERYKLATKKFRVIDTGEASDYSYDLLD
jgi:uncharacterized membrane protein